MISDTKMAYFDVRPSSHVPTLELRVCDSTPSSDDVALIAGIFRAVVDQAAEAEEAGVPLCVRPPALYQAAMWRAARSGLAADLLDDGCQPGPRPASEVVRRLLRRLRLPGWRRRAGRRVRVLRPRGPPFRHRPPSHPDRRPPLLPATGGAVAAMSQPEVSGLLTKDTDAADLLRAAPVVAGEDGLRSANITERLIWAWLLSDDLPGAVPKRPSWSGPWLSRYVNPCTGDIQDGNYTIQIIPELHTTSTVTSRMSISGTGPHIVPDVGLGTTTIS